MRNEIVVNKDITLKEIDLSEVEIIFHTIDTQRTYLGEWLPFVEVTRVVGDTKIAVENMIRTADRNLTFAIYYQNVFAGLIGYKDIDKANRKAEIGYWLSEQFQQKGIITESCKTLINDAFEKMDLYRVQICVAAGNKKSARIPEKLGFKKEGTLRGAELHQRGFFDIIVYGLLKSEWNPEF